MKKKKQTIYILSAILVLASAFILYKNQPSLFQNQTGRDDSAAFFFLPEKISVSAGHDFTLEVAIDPKKHTVSNADLILSYDKEKIRLDSISPSDKFSQVLSSSISAEGLAIYSASTDFGSNIDAKTTYATLHFHALGKTKSTSIAVDFKKSGIYADDNPGTNVLESSGSASVSITE